MTPPRKPEVPEKVVERVAKAMMEREFLGRKWDQCYARDEWRAIARAMLLNALSGYTLRPASPAGEEGELLPCPFCGSDDISAECSNSVQCDSCGASSFTTSKDDDEARRLWNRRTPQPVPDGGTDAVIVANLLTALSQGAGRAVIAGELVPARTARAEALREAAEIAEKYGDVDIRDAIERKAEEG